MAVTTGLYPPIVADTAPAFVRTQICRIYFSLSAYNSITDIKNVQFSLVNQKTNASALKKDLYPSGIKLTNLLYDLNIRGDYNYYIQINPKNDLEEEAFGLNQFYKIQLRFTSKSAPQLPPENQNLQNGTGLAKWLYNNIQYFSEWSKVCLIKGIERPIVSLRGFEEGGKGQRTILTTPLIEIIGKLTYEQNNDQEQQYLKSYNIKLYQENDNINPIVQSGEIFTNLSDPNEFNYQLSYNLLDETMYTLVLTYTTNNLYTKTNTYNFIIRQHGVDKLNANIIATKDEENGKIKIDIISKTIEPFIGNLTIRRTSSKSNFHIWEDVHTVTYKTGVQLNYTWYDTTVESGIWYKYCAQRRNALGDRGVIISIDEPIMIILDDIFLTSKNNQLKIKFNPSLNEFKYNVTQSQQTTIGSKFPYITRNGSNYYRSFPIGGLISSFMDTTDWYDPHFYDGTFHDNENEIKNFTSKAMIYGESKSLYDNYNNENNINEYNDYIYERQFRNKVYNFLYTHDVKLFRSTTQGNILIKLMNIDFQPVETLGRRLYSFTATAVQIDEATILNYDKYNIQKIGQYESYVVYEHEVLSQISGTFSKNTNIIAQIDSKHKKFSNKGFVNQIKSLKWLRIQIESPPYVIIEDNTGSLIRPTNTKNFNNTTNATAGHIVNINGKDVIIYPRIIRSTSNLPSPSQKASLKETVFYLGIFELKEKDTLITSLYFKQNTNATIDYIANLEQIEDTSKLPTKIYYYYKPGQLYGIFEPKDSLIKKIYNKYLLDYTKYYQQLMEITEVKIEGPPNAVIYIKTSESAELKRIVLPNGQLKLSQSDTNIEGLYFCGIHLTESSDPLDRYRVNGLAVEDFVLQENIYNSLEEITEPKNGNIYQLRAYGLKTGDFSINNKILYVDEQHVEIPITPDNYYTLLLEPIEDDETIQFIYYYGCWYVLSEGYEKANLLLKNDIRHNRKDEYIEVEGKFQSLEDIINPVDNGVYWLPSYAITAHAYEKISGLLTVDNQFVYSKADTDYGLYLQLLYDESKWIYYNKEWYIFTKDHDVICPVEGIVDYYCEIVKGVY